MASTDRTATHAVDTVLEALRQNPQAFHFFQALRHLECHYHSKPRLGTSIRLSDDPIRLAQKPSLIFAPATLAGFEPGGEYPPHLYEYFLGLFGPHGPLPTHLTEYAQSRLHNEKDPTFARFADIFHHRILCFFYRAWANTQPTVSFDRPESDRFNTYIGATFGLGTPSLWKRDAAPDLAKFHYAGRLSCQTHHAEGLIAILSDSFKLPISIDSFVGHWLPLSEESRCRLGETPMTGALGITAVIGERVWDCQYRFRIVMGPMSLKEFQRFLPGSDSLRRLVAWVRNYMGEELLWDVNLILRKDEVPPLKLGEESRLGWTTWLTSQPLAHDADNLKLDAVNYCT
ncbi:MAG: type VI secretion system baseplate subunit TssG [Candidatus Contendobacter odensis]|uniref:Type VI secretion system baseplate subunit TssG n=1 Tax=Candidatus Contendibacter odensensis TaxID=1400860 RepID=A0A2G6PEZ4_9GAMM|nr:MAG: type VI secretion system baseplate subunit TssG [Candidatus Contendobacter odensis]